MSDKNSQIEEELEVTKNSNIENSDVEVTKETEEVVKEETKEETKEESNLVPIESIKELSKDQEALKIITKAKEILKEADEEVEGCKLVLVSNLKEYEDAKKSLKSNGMDSCISLMEKMNCIDESIDLKEDITLFEPKDDLEPIYIQDLSSGKFTSIIYATLGGTLTLGGVVAYAMQKLGIPLNFENITSLETLKSVLDWFGMEVGRTNDIMMGLTVLGGVSLSIMAIIYLIDSSIKSNKNLELANKQLEDAKSYVEQKENCKNEMDKVDAHIQNTLSILKTYEVLFNEQKGKLERIIYIEGIKEDCKEYHEKSKIEIDKTNRLVNSIKNFISIPMLIDGKLSQETTVALGSVQKELDEVLKYLY